MFLLMGKQLPFVLELGQREGFAPALLAVGTLQGKKRVFIFVVPLVCHTWDPDFGSQPQK